MPLAERTSKFRAEVFVLNRKPYAIVLLAMAVQASGFAAENREQPEGMQDRQTMSNQFWWPDHLDLSPLRQHAAESNPYGAGFNYAKEFKKLDLNAVKADIKKVLTTSQDWWPADYGN